eukprot:365684-Chlamydomonas_euryale.AAC.14
MCTSTGLCSCRRSSGRSSGCVKLQAVKRVCVAAGGQAAECPTWMLRVCVAVSALRMCTAATHTATVADDSKAQATVQAPLRLVAGPVPAAYAPIV